MTTITTTELADKLGTDGRTLRKFLRSENGLNTRVGKGHRWSIEAKQVRSLTKRFTAWTAPKEDETDEVPDSPDEA